MNLHRSLVRKISYFVAIGVLLIPLFYLSMPATSRSQGGKLAQVRSGNKLHQADLGEIDPTSATMKLAAFGLNGIAVNRLWSTAIDAKEREDWTSFGAALEQIKNFQPHYVKVWQFQAHNVSFNISCEFDDYRDRYHQVMKGIDMLAQGIRNNERSVYLVRDEARFIGFKIGKSDEADLFRPMFRDDDEYHQRDPMKGISRYADRPETLRDNWQVSKWWYEKADELLFTSAASYDRLTAAVVHSDAPHSQIQYAKSLAEDGHFGDATLEEWNKAAREWQTFGTRLLPTSLGLHIRLAAFDRQRSETIQLRKDFDELVASEPGLKEKLVAERRAELSQIERDALDLKRADRSSQQQFVAEQAEAKLRLTPRDIALAMSPEHQDAGSKLADQLAAAEVRLATLERNREIVNYEYWRVRCEVERRPETLQAREEIYLGDQALAKSDLQGALTHYNRGLDEWKKVIDQYPRLLAEKTMVIELMQIVEKYQRILKQNDAPMPDPFPLQAVIKAGEEYARQDGVKTGM